jgi:hypothetical protein
MKLQDNLTCVFSYAYGLPKRILLEKHATCNNITAIVDNENLRRARYCAYLRQFLMISPIAIDERKYADAKTTSNNSMKDESTQADAIVYVVENKIIDIRNTSKVYQFRRLNSEFMKSFKEYLTEVFFKENYVFETEYLLELVNFDVSDKVIMGFYSHFGGGMFNKQARCYPFTRILNIPLTKFKALDPKIRNTLPNIYNKDEILLNFIYGLNQDTFNTSTLETVTTPEVDQISYEDFMGNGKKKVLFVDCENSNYYKILKVCKDDNFIKTVSKIVLVNDSHIDNSQTDWNKLSSEVSIPVEYMTVNRIIKDKSLVDGTLLIAVSCTYATTKCDIIIATSDSDFYILGSNLVGANICFLYEDCKVSDKFKDLLKTNPTVIGKSLDELSTDYTDLVLPELVNQCVNIINLLIKEQCDPIIRSAIRSQNLYDDDKVLSAKLKQEITKLSFKIEDNKLLVYKNDAGSLNG